jgi:predicted nucleic acid-binding protein
VGLTIVHGLDTNILSYALDPTFEEHHEVALILRKLSSEFQLAVNPTVIHETYHTLVYKQKWARMEVSQKLLSLIRLKNIVFLNQTKSTSRNAILLANKYELGGRDSLILSNYLFNNVSEVYSHDGHLTKHKRIAMGERQMDLTDPLA